VWSLGRVVYFIFGLFPTSSGMAENGEWPRMAEMADGRWQRMADGRRGRWQRWQMAEMANGRWQMADWQKTSLGQHFSSHPLSYRLSSLTQVFCSFSSLLSPNRTNVANKKCFGHHLG